MPAQRLTLLPALLLLACQSGGARPAGNPEVQTYLADYGREFQRLTYASTLAEWESNTRIVEGDSSNAIRTRRANEALARFVGSNENIARIRGYLTDRDRLSPLQARELEVMLYLAADKPEPAGEAVAQRIAAEAAQSEKLYGFQFELNGKPITPRPEVPIVLRMGANRAYHEGIGSMIGLASLQRRFLAGRNLVPSGARVDSMAQLLQEALSYVVFIPFAAGTMTRFEHALYTEPLPADRFNARWWELARKYQGIVPPSPRDERWADGLTKTHINDDAAQYYDYALSFALLFQLHNHIARRILNQDPHDTDYFGNRQVGDFLKRLMAPGASRPWRETLRETTGRELDAKAMVEYFQPLYHWLQQQNQGRKATLPAL